MSELCDLSAVALRRMIGRKAVSPREVLASCLKRIDQVNPALNAVVALDRPAAEAQALAAEGAVMAGEPLGLLHGLPLGIKDLNETAGLRTTHGSLLYENHVPQEDEPGVARLRAAGGLIVAKTNTPEFGAGAQTTNKVYGATGNPFDPSLTCAGSSGGSAVALAASMLPLCNGSDLGGSLRTPAAFCGVIGLRPTPGRVPACDSTRAFTPFSVEGPMGRSVEDVALLLAAQAAHDDRDGFARLGAPFQPEVGFADLARLKVAFSEDLATAPVAQAIRRVFRQRRDKLAPLFAVAETCDPPLQGSHEIFERLRAMGFLASFRDLTPQQIEKLGPNVRANIALGQRYSTAAIAEAEAQHTAYYRRFLDFMEQWDYLICPAAPISPFPKDQLYPADIDGQPMATYINWVAISYAITLTTHPSLVLPCGLDEKGLPFGIQIVGRRWGERHLLAVGQALEAAMSEIPACRRPKPDLVRLIAA